MTRKAMLATTLTLFLGLGVTTVLSQGYNDCDSCVKANMDWVLLPNCKTACVAYNTSTAWRRLITNYTKGTNFISQNCSNIIKCEIFDGYIKNPSFEEGSKNWAATTNATTCTNGHERCPNKAAAGNNYMWFCGFGGECTASIFQENIIIPREATHLSFFALSQLGTGNSGMNVYIDDTFLHKFISKNIGDSTDMYIPVDIYIKPYADGGSHKLTFKFVEFSPSDERAGTFIIDYLTFTKIDNCIIIKYLSILLYIYIYHYFLYNINNNNYRLFL